MIYHGIIFTNNELPFKASGAYSIATQLREHGYRAKVVEHFIYLDKNYREQFRKYIFNIIGKETIFIGVSTTFLYDIHDAYLFLTEIKKEFPHIKIISGGPREGRRGPITGIDDWDDAIDHHIIGFGDTAIISLLNDLKEGKKVEKLYEYDSLGKLFDFRNSKPIFSKEDDIIFANEVLPIEISRGCIFKCSFCNFPLLGIPKNDNKYIRCKESIKNELIYNYENFNTTNYAITDDTFNSTTEKVKLLKEIVEEINIPFNFIAYLRIDLIHAFPEQIDLLKDMGLKGAFFGIESLHDPSAKAVGKGFGKEKTIEMLHLLKEKWGKYVMIHGNFILGLPHESPQTFKKWANLILKPDFPLDSINIGSLEIYDTGPAQQSEFLRNSKKYGYTITGPATWKSIHPIKSSEMADVLLYYVVKPIMHKRYKNTMYGRTRFWNKWCSQNYGYTWKELVDNFPSINTIKKAETKFKDSYAHKLLNL